MKPKNGTTGESMMTLLGDVSSGSEVEWLNLPPVKGKKPRKKPSKRSSSVEKGCSLCTFFKILFTLVFVAALCILSVSFFWLSMQLQNLQDDLKRTDKLGESNTMEIRQLSDHLQELAKEMVGLKSGEQSLEQVFKNLTSFSQKLSQLSNTVDKLGEGLKAAPELKQIPEKLLTVSSSVADLGSNVAGMKESIVSHDKSLKDMTSQLNQLTERVVKLEKLGNQPTDHIDVGSDNDQHLDGQGSFMSPEQAALISKLQLLPNQFSQLNETVFGKLADVQLILKDDRDRLSSLENMAVILKNNISSVFADHNNLTGSQFDMVRKSDFPADPISQIMSLLKHIEMLVKKNESSSEDHINRTGSQFDKDRMSSYLADLQSQMFSVAKEMDGILRKIIAMEENGTAESGMDKLEQHTIDEIMENLDNITDVVAILKEEHQRLLAGGNKVVSTVPGDLPAGVVTLTMFQTFGEGIASEFDGVNVTLVKLHRDIDDILVSFTRHTNQIVNLTAQVEGLFQYIHRIETSLSQTPPGPQVTTVQGVTPTKQAEPKEPTTGATTSYKDEKQEPTTDRKMIKASPLMVSPTVKESPDQSNRTLPILHIQLITSEKDLERKFLNWDEDGSGLVHYDSLQNYLGPFTPDETQLKLFDFNHDGLYSLDEFKVALGYAQPPENIN
ncbi:hypothetical protein ACJMK2_042365 [Sinanodonta woodiana]|uniref:EF-hand domain-containing protein n=1 Tax=Sinanodonta woodiana TaxID=1069815 RepID=A0ABD3W855_SINWO